VLRCSGFRRGAEDSSRFTNPEKIALQACIDMPSVFSAHISSVYSAGEKLLKWFHVIAQSHVGLSQRSHLEIDALTSPHKVQTMSVNVFSTKHHPFLPQQPRKYSEDAKRRLLVNLDIERRCQIVTAIPESDCCSC
jgi:hypothetical protein